MATEEDVLELLQRQIDSLKESRQQQLQLNADKAAAEAALRNAAIQCAQGLVKLNVGGVKYTTSLTTLIAVPDSFFASLFSGDWQSTRTAEGDIFVDRDGEVQTATFSRECALSTFVQSFTGSTVSCSYSSTCCNTSELPATNSPLRVVQAFLWTSSQPLQLKPASMA